MASILISGPYVIRSLFANIKSWEDSVTDSFNDPLVECDLNSTCIPSQLLNSCDCFEIGNAPSTCGLADQGVQCAGTEYLITKS